MLRWGSLYLWQSRGRTLPKPCSCPALGTVTVSAGQSLAKGQTQLCPSIHNTTSSELGWERSPRSPAAGSGNFGNATRSGGSAAAGEAGAGTRRTGTRSCTEQASSGLGLLLRAPHHRAGKRGCRHIPCARASPPQLPVAVPRPPGPRCHEGHGAAAAAAGPALPSLPPAQPPPPSRSSIANPQAAPTASWQNCLVSNQRERSGRPPPSFPAPSRGTFPAASSDSDRNTLLLPNPAPERWIPEVFIFAKSLSSFARSWRIRVVVLLLFFPTPSPRCFVKPPLSTLPHPPGERSSRSAAAAAAAGGTSSICCENITPAAPRRPAEEVQHNSQAPGAKVSLSFSSPRDDFHSFQYQPPEQQGL